MRLFWTIIAFLALSTAAWWLLRAPESTPRPPAAPEAPKEPSPRVADAAPAQPAPSATFVPKTLEDLAPRQADEYIPPESTNSTPAPAISEAPKAIPAPAPATTDAPKPAAAKPAQPAAETLTDIASEMDKLLGIAPTPPAAPTPTPEASKPTPATPASAALPVKLTKQDDGSTLVDDKYVIKGTGTKDDPYRVTWEMLVSAQDTYQPRLGRKVIPERLKMIDGKWVRISGYIAFPIMSASPDEMLMMLNQWDGCCIGVPPTPYDDIEVKLKAPAKGNDRLRTTGTLTALFRVDPYLVKDWLVSLYIMDNGELTDAAGEAAQGQHAK